MYVCVRTHVYTEIERAKSRMLEGVLGGEQNKLARYLASYRPEPRSSLTSRFTCTRLCTLSIRDTLVFTAPKLWPIDTSGRSTRIICRPLSLRFFVTVVRYDYAIICNRMRAAEKNKPTIYNRRRTRDNRLLTAKMLTFVPPTRHSLRNE